MGLEEYEQARARSTVLLVAPGHDTPGVEREPFGNTRFAVEMVGAAALIAEKAIPDASGMSDSQFKATSHPLDGTRYVVSLAGEIDMYTAPDVRRELGAAIATGVRHVIVDLTETRFIDSTMLGVLIVAQKRLREKGGSLTIASSDRNPIKVFEITGLDRVFAIFSIRAEASEPSIAR